MAAGRAAAANIEKRLCYAGVPPPWSCCINVAGFPSFFAKDFEQQGVALPREAEGTDGEAVRGRRESRGPGRRLRPAIADHFLRDKPLALAEIAPSPSCPQRVRIRVVSRNPPCNETPPVARHQAINRTLLDMVPPGEWALLRCHGATDMEYHVVGPCLGMAERSEVEAEIEAAWPAIATRLDPAGYCRLRLRMRASHSRLGLCTLRDRMCAPLLPLGTWTVSKDTVPTMMRGPADLPLAEWASRTVLRGDTPEQLPGSDDKLQKKGQGTFGWGDKSRQKPEVAPTAYVDRFVHGTTEEFGALIKDTFDKADLTDLRSDWVSLRVGGARMQMWTNGRAILSGPKAKVAAWQGQFEDTTKAWGPDAHKRRKRKRRGAKKTDMKWKKYRLGGGNSGGSSD